MGKSRHAGMEEPGAQEGAARAEPATDSGNGNDASRTVRSSCAGGTEEPGTGTGTGTVLRA